MADADEVPDIDDIKEDVDRMVRGHVLEPGHRDTAILVLCALNYGCKNIDKLATLAELPREFVRPRAKRMRASGLWNADGTVSFEYADGPDETAAIELVLHVLCADGLVVCTWFDDVQTPVGNTQVTTVKKLGRWDRLLAWRSKNLSTVTAATLAESLTVESLPYADIPPDLLKQVTDFRRLTRLARLAASQSWLDRRLSK